MRMCEAYRSYDEGQTYCTGASSDAAAYSCKIGVAQIEAGASKLSFIIISICIC